MTTAKNDASTFRSAPFNEFTKARSLMCCLVFGPSNILAVYNFFHTHLKHFSLIYAKNDPFLSTAFTNCFIRSSLIWRGGKMFFSRSTKGLLLISPMSMFFLLCHSFLSHSISLCFFLCYPRGTGSKDIWCGHFVVQEELDPYFSEFHDKIQDYLLERRRALDSFLLHCEK